MCSHGFGLVFRVEVTVVVVDVTVEVDMLLT